MREQPTHLVVSTQLRHQALGEWSAVPLVEMSAELSHQLPTTENWERRRREQKAQIYPSPFGNSVYQFKLNISLLKSLTSEYSFSQITDI